MASDDSRRATIIDVNYLVPTATTPPAPFVEVWAVDPEELRRGSSSGAGRRDGTDLPVPLRWQWVATPPFDRAEVGAALEAAGRSGPRVVRLCPRQDGRGYPLASWLLAPLPELCDGADVAIALDYASSPSMPWVEVVGLARRHPSLPLVVLGRGAGELGVLRSCLDAAPNVIFELSGLGDPAWLRRTVGEVGAHRFVFGSGGDPRRAVDLLEAAGLAPEGARLVGSGVAELLDSGSWTESFL